ncbi:MAG: glucosaminidase domain-containing protein [Treponema sp.]|nr:glucosaminidase domain-containing protein [Treponema sp.]
MKKIASKLLCFRKNGFLLAILTISVSFFSCKSIPDNDIEPRPVEESWAEENCEDVFEEKAEVVKAAISRKILDKGVLTASQLAEYFLSQRNDFDLIEISHFAQMYVVEAQVEGINWDVAFAQMCLETGYLRFGGLVQPEFHNYCGLGAMDAEHPGCVFETEQLGVRAHIQHLQAYATTEDVVLNNELIDPRYSWVHKTKFVETIDGLSGTWATDPNYAVKIEKILCRMEEMFLNKAPNGVDE